MSDHPHPTIDTSSETVKSPASSIRSPDSPAFQSPLRHHQRKQSTPLVVKETRNARSEYSTREDDGASELRINQYIITQEIGRGSFGAVHLARDQHGHEYAVKEFSKSRLRRRAKSNMLRRPKADRFKSGGSVSPPGPTPTGGLIDAITRYPTAPSSASELKGVDNSFDLIKEEIAVMKKLHHNNLVSLIEVLDDPDEDSLFMVLELCKKGVIMKVEVDQAADPYEEESCRCWFRDLILAIEYLHAQGVVHRDIKPDNCLLTEDDTLKVVDFGVSEMFEKETDMLISKTAGSPAFMAPELCEVHQGHVSGRSADIWSMGVTLYCLRFGKVPFQKNTVWDLYQAILHDDVHIPDDCNPDLADLISKILEKDPSKRIKMPELREHPWVTLKGEDPLLSAEDNCAHPIGIVTQEEKDAAITDNMARFLAIMRAVNKFRVKFEKHRPELVERFMGRASRLVRHPVLVQRSTTESGMENVKDSEEMTETDLEAVEQLLQEEDMQDEQETKRGMRRLIKQLRQSSLTTYLQSYSSHHRGSEPAVEPLTSKESRSPPIPVPGIRKTFSEPPDTSGGRGHARDITDEYLYLFIGTGPIGSDEHTTGEEDYIVSESPPQADNKMYERAYQDEVTNILRRKGRATTVYLTRRVDRKKNEIMKAAIERSGRSTEAAKAVLQSWNEKVTEMSKNQPNTYRGQAKAGIASVLGKALTHGKAYMDAHPLPDSFGGSSSKDEKPSDKPVEKAEEKDPAKPSEPRPQSE